MIRKIKVLALSYYQKFSSLGAFNLAAAAPGGYQGFDLTIQSVFGIITGLVCWFTQFALILMVVYLVIYGIQFMMAQGNPTKFGAAKTSFMYGLLGILVILGTYTIIATIANALGANYNAIIPLKC